MSLLAIGLSLFLGIAFSSNAMTGIGTPDNVSNSEWQEVFSNDQVIIKYKYQYCNEPSKGINNEYVYFQFTNLTTENLEISFSKELWYNTKCITCNNESQEYNFTVKLNPGEYIEGKCGETNDRALYIFSKMADGLSKSELTSFNLKNIKTIIL